jgi:uncharacterized RDD family membrane protein YckC
MADFDLGAARREPDTTQAPRRRRGTGDAAAPHNPDFDPRITPPARAAIPDLPLFGDGPDDLPIVPAAAPAPPLAVRRSTPLAAKARPRPTPRTLEPMSAAPLPLSLEAGSNDAPQPVAARLAEDGRPASGIATRALAALLDALLLVGTDAVVVYFTLQICRLAPADVLSLPLAPLLAFLALLNGGYLVLLTAAGGQTLGKMAFGLKVVAGDEGPVTVGRSLLRTAALLVSALPAGLGLLPALFTAGHRGLHDHLADTRVVRVPAAGPSRPYSA